MDQIKQIIATFNATRQHDPSVVPTMAMAVAATVALTALLGVLLGPWWLWLIFGILAVLAVTMIVLGRKAQSASIAAIEGQAGAAAAVLQSMRGAWEVTPAVAFNRREDMIHLAVGRAGVVLVGEGRNTSVRQLMAKEQKRFERVAGDVDITQVLVGDGDDQVELGSLAMHMARLPRSMKAKEVGPLHRKLGALKASSPPMPKGPQMRRAPKKYR